MTKFESRYTTVDKYGVEYEHLRRIVHVGPRRVMNNWCKFASESKWTYTSRTIEKVSEWDKAWDASRNWQVEGFTNVKGVRQTDKPWSMKDFTK